MKTAITEVIEIVEMDYNNGVIISMKAFYNMLKHAKEKEKQQTIDFASKCQLVNDVDCDGNVTFCFDPKEHFDKTFS